MPAEGPTIGNWTSGQLVKFFQNMLRLHPPESAVNLTADEINVTKTLKCTDQVQFFQVQATVGATGTASALPANPAGYIRILDYAGNVKLIPYYNS